MKMFLRSICAAGLLMGMLMAGGCGSDDNYVPIVYNPDSVGTNIYPPTPTSNPPNTHDASFFGANYNYYFQSSTTDYTYTISNFATGDKMIFPSGGSLLSVDNSNFTDGKAKIICVSGGFGTITAELARLTTEQDAKIISIDSINALFGAGTVTQK